MDKFVEANYTKDNKLKAILSEIKFYNGLLWADDDDDDNAGAGLALHGEAGSAQQRSPYPPPAADERGRASPRRQVPQLHICTWYVKDIIFVSFKHQLIARER